MPKPRLRRQANKAPIAETNLLPFIDVILVLLLVFMVTAPLLTPGIDVDLPTASNSTPKNTSEQEEPLVISIDAQGRYYLELGQDSHEPIALELVLKQTQALRQQNEDLPVLVRGDRQVAYELVIQLLNALESAGISKVSLITQPEPLR